MMISSGTDRGCATATLNLALALAAALIIAGCGGGGSGGSAGGPLAGRSFSGRGEGGGPPIVGSAITFYAMGATGFGTGASVLATATSNSLGGFNIQSYNCPQANPGAQTYIVATGGNAGSGSNSAIGLMALSGPCNQLTASSFVTINELTTVAAQWALSQFSDSTGLHFGTSPTNATGLNNAVNQAEVNLVVSYRLSGGNSSNTDLPASFLNCAPSSLTCEPRKLIDTLANIIARCVNSLGSSSACSTLFNATGLPSSSNTLAVAHRIATNPFTNVNAIFSVQGNPSTQPFQPALTSGPGNLTLLLTFAPSAPLLGGPWGVAIDAAGNVWVADTSGSVAKLTSSGRLVDNFNNSNTPGANFANPRFVAIDAAGNAWVTNQFGGSATKLTSSGTLAGNFNNSNTPGTNFNEPLAVAIDAVGDAWVANCAKDCSGFGNPGSVTKLTSNGSLAGNFNNSNTPNADFAEIFGIAIDAGGDVRVTNSNQKYLKFL